MLVFTPVVHAVIDVTDDEVLEEMLRVHDAENDAAEATTTTTSPGETRHYSHASPYFPLFEHKFCKLDVKAADSCNCSVRRSPITHTPTRHQKVILTRQVHNIIKQGSNEPVTPIPLYYVKRCILLAALLTRL